MRKPGILPLLAAAAALMMAFSGCGGGEPSSQESQASSQSQSASESSTPESSFPASAPESGAASESSTPESASSQASAPAASSQSTSSQGSAPASSSQAAPAESILYQGEEVLEVWALDVESHTTVPYVSGGENQPDRDRLEAALNDAPAVESGDKAFIVFTQEGRRYVYLGEDPSGELSSVWEQVYNSLAEKNIHWLTHMTPEKIVSVEAVGLGKTAKTEITHRQTLNEIATWLKKNLTADVSKGVTVKDGPDNPDSRADGYFLRISFDTGVEYTLIGYGELDYLPNPDGTYLSLYTSDLDQTARYTLTPGSVAALRTFFDSLV
jgi:hypothetical protein